jgi:hypothetical protein
MNASHLKPEIIIRGPMLPEPISVLKKFIHFCGEISPSKVEMTRVALHKLGLPENVSVKRGVRL